MPSARGDAIVKVSRCGICGSDLHICHGLGPIGLMAVDGALVRGAEAYALFGRREAGAMKMVLTA